MILAALALSMAVVAGAGPSAADHNLGVPLVPLSTKDPNYLGDQYWSWSNCSWNRESRTSLRVAQSTFYPFPNNNTAPDNGAPQSFRARINEALIRWRTLYQSASPRPKSLTKVSDGAENEILFQYRDPTDPRFLGQIFVRRTQDSSVSSFTARCPLRQTSPRHQLYKAQIRIRKRTDWFTQPDSYVTNWENCTNTSTYTCSKTRDLGSVVAHEFGHAFGLHHTEDAESFDPVAENPWGCAEDDFTWKGTRDQPTMCRITPSYTGFKRTLELNDEGTLHKHVEKNG